MAESITPAVVTVNIGNGHTDTGSSPTTVAAKIQVYDGSLRADDRMTNPGVLV